MGQCLPYLLGDERHKGMQEHERVAHDPNEHLLCVLSFGAALLKSYLGYLDIPVAENIPDEIIELRDSHAQLEFLKVIGNFLNKVVVKADDPLILESEVCGQLALDILVADIHQNESRSVPQLVGKVAARADLLVGESHIVAGAVARGKSEPKCIRTVLVDYLERINTVAERL